MPSGLLAVLIALAPVAFVIGGVGLGLVLERLFLPRLPPECDVLHGATPVVLGLVGTEAALRSFRLDLDARAQIDQVLVVTGILIVTVVTARLCAAAVDRYVRREDLPAASVLSGLAVAAVAVIGALVALGTIGISVAPVLVAVAVGGFATALALKDTLANFLAGMQILGSGLLGPGDYVKLENGLEGFVVEVTWRSTAIREIANNLIVVPNEKVAQSITTNFHRPDASTGVTVDVGVDFASDLDLVERVAFEVARSVQDEFCEAESSEPVVRFRDFAESHLVLRIGFRAPSFAQTFSARSVFIKRLHERFRAERIAPPYPVRTIEIADRGRRTPPPAGSSRTSISSGRE